MDSVLGDRLRNLQGPIFVTGHTGFKGTWLTLLLEQMHIPVVGYSLPAKSGSLFERANRLGAIPELLADIRDVKAVTQFMHLHQPSVVLHLAAQPLVLESYKFPQETFDVNVMGTVNTLAASFATTSVKAVGVITTDKVYRNDNSGRSFKEGDALAGKDPYSASKVGAESAVSAWQQISKISGGPSVVALRAGNVIGGGDWADDRLIPDLVKAFMARETITLRNPNSTRPWQHVLDPLAGYLVTIEKMLSGVHVQALNFGPDSRSLSVQRIAEVSAQVWPNDVSIDSSRTNELGSAEAQALDLDSALAREILGWSPIWSQEEAVVSSIEWWDKVINQQVSPYAACSTDIDFLLARNIQV